MLLWKGNKSRTKTGQDNVIKGQQEQNKNRTGQCYKRATRAEQKQDRTML